MGSTEATVNLENLDGAQNSITDGKNANSGLLQEQVPSEQQDISTNPSPATPSTTRNLEAAPANQRTSPTKNMALDRIRDGRGLGLSDHEKAMLLQICVECHSTFRLLCKTTFGGELVCALRQYLDERLVQDLAGNLL